MSAQSLSLSVKMFLHHCQSSLGTIRNIQKTVFPDKTTVLNAALQLVDPYIFTLPSDSSCFYICVIIPCAKITLLFRHPQKTYKIKAHTCTSLEWLGYSIDYSLATASTRKGFSGNGTILVHTVCSEWLLSWVVIRAPSTSSKRESKDNTRQQEIQKHSFHSCSGNNGQQQTHIQDVHHSLQDGSGNRTIIYVCTISKPFSEDVSSSLPK